MWSPCRFPISWMRDPSRKYEAGPRTEPDKLWCDNLARRWHCVIFLPQTLIKLQQWLIQCEMKWSNIIRDHRFINVFQNIHFVLNQMISICMTTEAQQSHQMSNVFVFCRSFISRGEMRRGFDAWCQSLSEAETRWGQSLSVSKCIHLTLTVHVIITIIGDSCSTPWYQVSTWFLDFLHQILNDNNGCLQRQSRHKELNPASGKIVRDDDEEK